VGNLACGFDTLGLALESPGDIVAARLAAGPGVTLDRIEGDEGRLPLEADRNTATVAARALLDAAGIDQGVELTLSKGLPLASGLGSSAASAVAAVVAVDALLGLGRPRPELLAAALAGEQVASGGRHADNVAPCLYGGCTLVRSSDPLDVVSLPVPPELTVAILHPHLEVSTREARSLLPRSVPLATAVGQWANLGGFVAALFRSDWELMSRSLHDLVAEPVRAPLVPGFAAAKQAALEAGALGASLSGAGPALFALCRGRESAQLVAEALAAAFRTAANTSCDTLVSGVNVEGASLLEPAS
jgi:homoserine kinase